MIKYNVEYLEVDDDQEDEDGGENVVEVGETRSVEGILECVDFV